MKDKQIVGIIEPVSIKGFVNDVPAKVDTGADRSAIWASDIHIDKNGLLKFKLFDVGSPYYNGEVLEKDQYSVVKVRSSNGTEELRYQIELTVIMAGRRLKTFFNLSDRSKNKYKILIGRRTLKGKFLVDVSKGWDKNSKPIVSEKVVRQLEVDPYGFHKQHMKGLK